MHGYTKRFSIEKILLCPNKGIRSGVLTLWQIHCIDGNEPLERVGYYGGTHSIFWFGAI